VTSLRFRPAEERDLDRLVEIHTTAFPDPRRNDARVRNFTANPFGALPDLHVAIDGHVVVAHAFLFPLALWFGGARVATAGIASVGVAPEVRGRGVGAELLAHLHETAEGAGASLLLLYAFRQGFYARHGYAPVTPSRRLAVHPASIPGAWRDEPGVEVRAAGRGEGDRASIESVYARAASRSHGWLARPRALWDRRFADERTTWLLATREGGVVGYVAWSLEQAEDHAATRLFVRELACDDDGARRALLGAVGAMRDQVHEVQLDLDARDPLDRALVDADRARFGDARVEHALGTVVGGPMVRLVDAAHAIEARGFAGEGAIDLALDGREPVGVEVRNGRATVVPAAGRPRLAIDRASFGAVLYGGLAPTDAARLGWARADAGTLSLADALFASPPFHSPDPF
jgi:predicted acetyltransferase